MNSSKSNVLSLTPILRNHFLPLDKNNVKFKKKFVFDDKN